MLNFLRISLLFSFLCFMTNSYGQNAIGGKVGINISKWTGDTEEFGGDIGSNFGFQIGGIFEIGINEKISIQPELVFIQKGIKIEDSDNFGGQQIDSKTNFFFNYLDLPVLLKIKFGNAESTNFFFTVGPAFGFALSGKVKSEVTFGGETEKGEEDFEFGDDDGVNRFDVSASVGAGVNIPVGPGNLFIEARYLLGLTNLNDDPDDDSTIKNSGIGIGVGFMAPIGE